MRNDCENKLGAPVPPLTSDVTVLAQTNTKIIIVINALYPNPNIETHTLISMLIELPWMDSTFLQHE